MKEHSIAFLFADSIRQSILSRFRSNNCIAFILPDTSDQNTILIEAFDLKKK